jgi:chromosome segregation ATPase
LVAEEKPIRVKRTDKTPRKTQGNFYSEFKRYDARGKSSKVMRTMIEELLSNVRYQVSRYRKLWWHIHMVKLAFKEYKKEATKREKRLKILIEKTEQAKQKATTTIRETYKRKLTNVRNKVNTRDNRVEILNQELETFAQEKKTKDREIAKLLRQHERDESEKKEIRSRKRRVVVKKVEQPLPLEVKQMQARLAKPAHKRGIDILDISTKLTKFCADNGLTDKQLTSLLQCEVDGKLTTASTIVATRNILEGLEKLEYLGRQLAGGIYIYFLTPKGQQTVKDYKNYISYGKTLI